MEILIYLLQVIVYTALMYALYILFLRNRAIHGFNRAYLLAAAFVPVVLPLVKFPGLRSVVALGEMAGVQLPEVGVSAVAANTVNNIFWYAGLGYGAVVFALLAVAIVQHYKLRKLIRNHEQEVADEYTLVKNTGYGPGSWSKYILLPGSEMEPAIVAHEAAHIRLFHSRDMRLLQMLQIAFWPNFFMYLIKKELIQVHEFQADAAVRMDTNAYASLLLSNVFGRCHLPLTHSFIIHPIKRRIMMLSKNQKSKNYGFARIAGTLGMATLIACAVAIQSCAGKKWEVRDNAAPIAGNESPVAKVQPEFNGDLMAFMGSHLQYPKEAQDKKIEGRVIISFVVDKNGTVTNPEVLKSPDPMLSEAAMSVIQQMPAWTPGKDEQGNPVAMKMTLPVSFKL